MPSDTVIKSRRVIVGMSASSDSSLLLGVTKEIAIAINAEIAGVFVEEESLFDLCSLPFTKGIQAGALQAKNLTISDMEKAMQRHAILFENALSMLALDSNLTWTYKNLRGDFAIEVPSIAGKNDLVLIQSSPSCFTLPDIISEGRGMADKAGGLVVCVQRKKPNTGPVVAIDDGDEAGLETIRLAKRMAESKNVDLVLFILAKTDEDAERILNRDLGMIGELPSSNRVFVDWQLQEVLNALREVEPGYMVADLHGEPFVDNESANALIRAGGSPAILLNVRD